MKPPFPDRYLEQPHTLDISTAGRVAVLDRGGRRLCLGRAGEAPVALALDFTARRCRFRRDELVLLGDEQVRTLAADGTPRGVLPLRAGAVNLAVMRSGSVIVTYGRRGAQEHGITLERLGPAPLLHREDSLLDATCLAVESGAFWVAGTGSAAPAARAVRYRPVAAGLSVRRVVPLPSPPRAAALGPDGALYILLEPGESLVRIAGARPDPAVRLREPLHDLARGKQSLWGVGPRGLFDLTHVVPPLSRPPSARR